MRYRTTTRALRLLAACAVAGAAMAGAPPPAGGNIWRCGNSYSGTTTITGGWLEVGDARSEDQRRDALRGAQDNAVAAQQRERQRRRAEAAQPAAVLIGLPAAKPPAKAATKPKKSKRAEPERFIATDPASVAKRSSKASKKK